MSTRIEPRHAPAYGAWALLVTGLFVYEVTWTHTAAAALLTIWIGLTGFTWDQPPTQRIGVLPMAATPPTLRDDLIDAVLEATELNRGELTADGVTELNDLVTALLRVVHRHDKPSEWTEGTVMDVVSNVLTSLIEQDALKGDIDHRSVVAKALESAGIAEGAVR